MQASRWALKDLQALTMATSRSNFRTNEIRSVQPPVTVGPTARTPMPGAAAISPAPAPPAADDDPFKDDTTNMAAGNPIVESDDALKGADTNPFGNDGAAGGDDMAAGGGDPFGGGDAGAADPFGGSDAAADPFGGGGDGAADPFGGGGAMDDDPFN